MSSWFNPPPPRFTSVIKPEASAEFPAEPGRYVSAIPSSLIPEDEFLLEIQISAQQI